MTFPPFFDDFFSLVLTVEHAMISRLLLDVSSRQGCDKVFIALTNAAAAVPRILTR